MMFKAETAVIDLAKNPQRLYYGVRAPSGPVRIILAERSTHSERANHPSSSKSIEMWL